MSSPVSESATSSLESNPREVPAPTIYPPVTHSLSPTWFTWVKLTCYEIHHVLNPAPSNFASLSYSSGSSEHRSPAIYHYINHPIQWVSVAGVVVEVDEFKEKYYICYVDDGSGETIEVIYPRPEGAVQGINGVASSATQGGSKLDSTEIRIHQLLSGLEPGHVLKVQGQIRTFRSCRQIRVERVQRILGTNEEAKFWSSMHSFHETVLSKPWILTDEDVSKTKVDAQQQLRQREAKLKRHGDREEERRHKLEKIWQREEKKRAEEAQKVRTEAEDAMEVIRRRREHTSDASANTERVLETPKPMKEDDRRKSNKATVF